MRQGLVRGAGGAAVRGTAEDLAILTWGVVTVAIIRSLARFSLVRARRCDRAA